MEVRPGYKRTEVGVIPEDWEVKSLKELADIQRGASPRPISSPVWYDPTSKVGWVRISDVTNSDGKHLEKTRDYFSDKGIVQSRYLPSGSLIMSICATVGMPVITRIDACIHDGFVGFTKLRQVDQTFLYYKLKELEPAFKTMGQTGSQNNLNSDLVRECLVALPPLPEQRAIAAVLSDVDALITALDRLIAKKRAIKQGAMQQLLTGKTRLPGFSGAWEVKKLGEIGDKFINGGTPSTHKTEYWNGSIPWITGADIINQKITQIRRFITKEAVKNSSTNIVEKGNLLIVTRTGVGKMTVAHIDLAISQDLTGVYLKNEQALPEYVFRYFDYNSDSLTSLNQGTSIAGITRETLTSMTILLPPLPEQTAIAAVLSDMDAEIAALEARRDKTRALKQGMMQELLTGRIRLVG